MDELITWLRAQLGDDERVAREAQDTRPGPWAVRSDAIGMREIYSVSRDEERGGDSNVMPDAWHDEATEHIARWDPARVLAEVEAKRRVLARYEDAIARQQDAEHSQITAHVQAQEYEDWIIPALAQPYAGRPGWREEWAA